MTKSERPKKYSDKHKSRKQVTSSSEESDPPPHIKNPREADLSDLLSQYIVDIETFRQVLNIPDLRDNMPVSSLTVLVLNPVAQKQVLRPKGPPAFLPANPSPIEVPEKFEQDFKNDNLSEGKFIKPPPVTGKWYKMVHPCFKEKLQDLYRDFVSIWISPRPTDAKWGKVKPHMVKDFEFQAQQIICTLNFSAAFNQVISECNGAIKSCRDNIKATVKWGKNHIQIGKFFSGIGAADFQFLYIFKHISFSRTDLKLSKF